MTAAERALLLALACSELVGPLLDRAAAAPPPEREALLAVAARLEALAERVGP